MNKSFILFGILLLLLFLTIANNDCTAQTGTAGLGNPLLDLGYGARAVGMGGAFVAVADDGNAGYWNPAGLSQLRQVEITSMYTSLYFGTKFFYLSLSIPLKKLTKMNLNITGEEDENKKKGDTDEDEYSFAGDKDPINSEWGGISIGWVEFFVSDIKSTAEIRDPVTGKPFTYYGDFNIREDAILVAYGIDITKYFALGFNTKFIFKDYQINDIFGWGVGFDAGTLIKPFKNFRIGILFQDVAETTLFWKQVVSGVEKKSTERIKSRLKFGVSYDLADLFYTKKKDSNKDGTDEKIDSESSDNKENRFTSGLIISTEFRRMIAKDQPVTWHVGLEWNILEVLFLRFGFDDLNVTAGAGVGYKIIYFDYSFVHHPYLVNTHRISFSAKF